MNIYFAHTMGIWFKLWEIQLRVETSKEWTAAAESVMNCSTFSTRSLLCLNVLFPKDIALMTYQRKRTHEVW